MTQPQRQPRTQPRPLLIYIVSSSASLVLALEAIVQNVQEAISVEHLSMAQLLKREEPGLLLMDDKALEDFTLEALSAPWLYHHQIVAILDNQNRRHHSDFMDDFIDDIWSLASVMNFKALPVEELSPAQHLMLALRRFRKTQAQTLKQQEKQETLEKVVQVLAEICEHRDISLGGHIQRVSLVCEVIVQGLQPLYPHIITDAYIQNLKVASMLHDIGKLTIPEHILNAPRKLDAIEFEVMKTHVLAGADMIKKVMGTGKRSNTFLEMVYNIVKYHHEKWDGTGYPQGLQGEAIPLEARIVQLADIYDSLRSPRVYKTGYSIDHSVDILKQEGGTIFEPRLIIQFLTMVEAAEKARQTALKEATLK